jgi:hypothetical protein
MDVDDTRRSLDDTARAAVVAACDAVGTCPLRTADIRSARGFWDDDRLGPFLDAASAALGRERHELAIDTGEVIRRLVVTHLLPRLAEQGTAVTIRDWGKNPARTWTVNGLTNNDEAVPSDRVEVSGAHVAEAILAALAREELPASPGAPRDSVFLAGLAAFVGRRVEIHVSGEAYENIKGRLLGIVEYGLVVAPDVDHDEEPIGLVPFAAIRMISSSQLTESEERDVRAGR